jgi:hypothetical protein
MRAADASDVIAASVCLELGFEAVQDLSVLEDDNRRKEVAVLLAGRVIAHLGKGDVDSLVDELDNDLLVIAQRARATEPPDFRQHPWFLRQPLYVQVFINDVRPGKDSSHPDVECTCGQVHASNNFERKHLRSQQHETQLWQAVRDSEAELIARAERSEWHVEQAERCMAEAAHVIVRLQDELAGREVRRDEPEPGAAQLRRQLDEVRAKLVAEQRASTKLEGALRQQQKTTIDLLPHLARSRGLCEVAREHQRAYLDGVFESSSLAAAAQELWHDALRRMRLRADGLLKLGGTAAKLGTDRVRALWLYIYNNGRERLYSMLQGVLAGPQLKLISQMHREEFVAQGHPREFAKRMAKFFRDLKYPPEEGLFILNWDAAKMQARKQWDQRSNGLVGGVDFDTNLQFNSYQDWVDFRDNQVAAGYILPFAVCASHQSLPMVMRLAALIPTNLEYTADDLHGYLTAIRANLFGEGFRYLIVEGADNGGPHRTEMVRRALPEHYPDERKPGGPSPNPRPHLQPSPSSLRQTLTVAIPLPA